MLRANEEEGVAYTMESTICSRDRTLAFSGCFPTARQVSLKRPSVTLNTLDLCTIVTEGDGLCLASLNANTRVKNCTLQKLKNSKKKSHPSQQCGGRPSQ